MNFKKMIGRQRVADQSEHDEMIDVMRGFFDNSEPQVGVFWYDYFKNTLFGVEKDDAEKYVSSEKVMTLPKLHRDYWEKQHYHARGKGDRKSIFYGSKNYTLIPRGRIFVRQDGTLYVAVGEWIDGYINGNLVIDKDKLRDLLIDEFNLPDDFEFVIDEHWNIGRGWSEEKF